MIVVSMLGFASLELGRLQVKSMLRRGLAPFSLAGALLLFGLLLNADSATGVLRPEAPGQQARIDHEIAGALGSIHATMVPLAVEAEAAMAGALAERTRSFRDQKQQLSAELDELEAQYAALVKRHRVKFADWQADIERLQDETRRLHDQNKSLKVQLNISTLAEPVLPAGSSPERDHEPASDGRSALAAAQRAAWQIADGLERTRRVAMLQQEENVFALDLESRVATPGSTGEVVRLDPALDLMLSTATTELMGGSKGGIRFFADGRSTGGRIGLEVDGVKAAVSVDWATGAVTVGPFRRHVSQF